ncbi:thy-1 membrane glycoprotein [Salminus brasiliensis]|uniref:thy-1 membrane glycoprotein n=1 Tax=Salminus brasiliensis TaxID=930266 RepID=UPI003B83A02B
MIYHSILFSFCLMGVASIDTTKCLIEDNKLQITCKSPEGSELLKCTVTTENKVVASTDKTVKQDSDYKNKAEIIVVKEFCNLTLTGPEVKIPKKYNCSLDTKESVEKLSAVVDTTKVEACSACNVLQNAGVTLLLALLAAPLLS